MYTLHFKEGLISFFLFTRFTIIRIVYARAFFDVHIYIIIYKCIKALYKCFKYSQTRIIFVLHSVYFVYSITLSFHIE